MVQRFGSIRAIDRGRDALERFGRLSDLHRPIPDPEEHERRIAEKAAEVQRMMKPGSRQFTAPGGPRRGRPVFCESTGQMFPSVADAAHCLDLPDYRIARSCRTGAGVRGLTFSYIEGARPSGPSLNG